MAFESSKSALKDNCFEEDTGTLIIRYVVPVPQKLYAKTYDLIKSVSKSPNNQGAGIVNVPVRLELNESIYGTRQPVSLLISSTTLEGLGNYSVSVRKVDEMEAQFNTSSLNYKSVYPQKDKIEKLILASTEKEPIYILLGLTGGKYKMPINRQLQE